MKLCKDCVNYGGPMPDGRSGYCRRKIQNQVTGEFEQLGGDRPSMGVPIMFAEYQRRWPDLCGPEAQFFKNAEKRV